MFSRLGTARFVLLFGLLGVGLFAYLPSFAGVRLLDDVPFINARSLSGFLSSSRAFTHSRGVAIASFAANYSVHGLELWGYHLVNLLIHLANSLFVYSIVAFSFRTAGYADRKSGRLSLLVAALFLVHPLQTNAVTYLIQRMESLMALFLLASLFCLIRFRVSGKSIWATGVVVCCALGMRTKEVMVAAPILLLAYDYLFFAPAAESRKSRFGRWLLPVAVCATWVLNSGWYPLWESFTAAPETQVVDASAFRVDNLSAWEYFRTQPQVIFKYIQLVVWPADLCLDRGWPVAEGWAEIVIPGLILLALFVWTAVGVWQRKKASFLGVWFFVILAPTSSLVPIKDLYFEHRMYLPILSCFAAGAILLDRFLGLCLRQVRPDMRAGAERAVMAGAVIIVVSFAWVTHERNRVYADPLVMWADCIQKSPNSARAYYSFAQHVEDRNLEDLYPLALEYAKTATELAAGESSYWNVLGLMQRKFGNEQAAIECFETARELDPTSAIPLLNLGNLYALEEPERAKGYFEQALEREPRHEDANNNYGTILRREGKAEQAIPYFEQAIASNPKLWPAYLNLGDVYLEDQPDKALEYYLAVPTEHYDNPGVFNNIAMAILRTSRDLPAAMKYWRESVTYFPDNVDAWLVLIDMTARLSGREAALPVVSLARKRFPNDPRIETLLRSVYAEHSSPATEAAQGSGASVSPGM